MMSISQIFKRCLKRRILVFCRFFILFFSLNCLINASAYSQEEDAVKKILFIGSESADSYINQIQITNLKKNLKEYCEMYYIFMDNTDIDNENEYKSFKNRTVNYIGNKEFDVFVVSGNEAFRFILNYKDTIVKEKPIVFIGVSDTELIREGMYFDNITGIKDVMYFDENVLLAKRLFPSSRSIYLITDNSSLGNIGSDIFKNLPIRFKGIEFEEINVSENDYLSLRRKIDLIGTDSVIFFLSAKNTIDGPSQNVSKFLLDSFTERNIPVMCCSFTGVKEGVLGGYFTAYDEMGYAAGEILWEIFEGINLRYMNVNSDCPARYCFDVSVMEKFHLRKKQLPNETMYVNDTEGFVTTSAIVCIIIIVFCLIIVPFIVVTVYLVKKQRLTNELLRENRHMLHAVMDQSETVYWECDFSGENQRNPFERETQTEVIEELEPVDDKTPLGKVEGEEIPRAIAKSQEEEELDKELFSLKHEDIMMGWIYSRIIQNEYRDQFDQMFRDFKDGKTKKSIEIDIPIGIEDIRNNVSTERWKHIVYRAIKTENDRVIRAICSATDVTSQKRAEREYEGIMKYQSFVQQSYPAYTRLNLTKNTVLERFINVPDLYKSIKGNSAVSELIFLKDLVSNKNQNSGFASTLEREELIIAFKNGTRKKECEFGYRMSNGALHWFDFCMELAFNPSSGDIEAYCYLKDITSQTISSITKDSVLNEDVEYIFWLNRITGVCQFINKSENLKWIPENEETFDYGVLIEEFLKKKVADADKEKVREDFDIRRIEKELESTDEVKFTYHTRKEDGSIEIKQEKVYYLEPGANVLIYVGTDITAITMMENQQNEKLALAIKQAERANLAKSDFLSRMSHDLRTPMNGIMGIAELASKELTDPAALEKDISKIRSSSAYMLGLLNDILDMSKIESGKLEIRNSKTSVGEIIENITTLAHAMCDKNGITFYCNRNPENYRQYFINADRLHTQQVIMNLISNASKFTPVGGTIEFLIENDGEENNIIHLRLIVRDTGVGMTKEFQKIMYDAFTQDKNSVNKVGTGLGLAIVHNLVKLMGGTIECVSAPGEGTEFTIRVDIEKIPEENPSGNRKLSSARKKGKAKEKNIKGKRALLVEDNELNQEIASRLLMNEGMTVEIAGNGLEALNTFTEKPQNYYDIILMDVMMPVMDGLEATHLLRNLEREDVKKIPIIAMTANAFTEDIEKCLKAGMNTHIAKPIETEKMIQTIKDYIG